LYVSFSCIEVINVGKLRSTIERLRKQRMLTDEYRYKILKILEVNPEISQRDLARELDISLGRANFCLKALIEKGLLKATNFRNSHNKLAYMYLLTPSGIEAKSAITAQFLKIKMQEYANLQAEIQELRREVGRLVHSEVHV
jgi:EPS-associated MarR family transcriptional regulator